MSFQMLLVKIKGIYMKKHACGEKIRSAEPTEILTCDSVPGKAVGCADNIKTGY